MSGDSQPTRDAAIPTTSLAGVAVGLVSTARFGRALERRGERLLQRIFADEELAYARRKRDGTHNLAARFAAKCAARRALRSIGLAPGWRDLEVVRRRSGEPGLSLRSGGQDATGLRFALSLTHDPGFAAALLWVERGTPT